MRFAPIGAQRFYLDDVQVTEISDNPWYEMCEKTSLSRLGLPSQFFTEEELQALNETISTEAWEKPNAESILLHAENLV